MNRVVFYQFYTLCTTVGCIRAESDPFDGGHIHRGDCVSSAKLQFKLFNGEFAASSAASEAHFKRPTPRMDHCVKAAKMTSQYHKGKTVFIDP